MIDTYEAASLLLELLQFTGEIFLSKQTSVGKNMKQPLWWNANCQELKHIKYAHLNNLR